MDLYLACAALVAAWGVRWLLAAPRRALTVAARQGPALRAANALLWLPCALRDRFGVRVPRVGFMLGRPLSLAALMAAAERRTDWGASASFPALFGLAVDRLNEARPSPVGRLVAFDYLMRRLEATKCSLPSLGSMFRTFADMCDAGDVDLGAIGAEQLAFWSAAVASAERFARERAHVAYDDLVGDPAAALARVYGDLGLDAPPDLAEAVAADLAGGRAAAAASVPRAPPPSTASPRPTSPLRAAIFARGARRAVRHAMMTIPPARQIVHDVAIDPKVQEGGYSKILRNPSTKDLVSLNHGIGGGVGGKTKQAEQGFGLCGDDGGRAMYSGIFDAASDKYGQTEPRVEWVAGSTVDLQALVTAHHLGWFEFRLCPMDAMGEVLTQECLNEHVLKFDADYTRNQFDETAYSGKLFDARGFNGAGVPWGTCCTDYAPADKGGGACSDPEHNDDRWMVPDGSTDTYYDMRYVLPAGVTCEHCVLQWTYVTGNSVDNFPEVFRNCADVRIVDGGGSRAPSPRPTAPAPTPAAAKETPAPTTTPAATAAAAARPATRSALTARATRSGRARRPRTSARPTRGGHYCADEAWTAAPTPTPPVNDGGEGCECRSASEVTSDAWCWKTECAKEYVDAGFCAYKDADGVVCSGGSGGGPGAPGGGGGGTKACDKDSVYVTSGHCMFKCPEEAPPANTLAPTPATTTTKPPKACEDRSTEKSCDKDAACKWKAGQGKCVVDGGDDDDGGPDDGRAARDDDGGRDDDGRASARAARCQPGAGYITWNGEAIYDSMSAADVLEVMKDVEPAWKNEYNWMKVKINALIDYCKTNNKRFLWAFGGWSDLTKTIDDDQVAALVDQLVQLLAMGADGIDFDWEHLSKYRDSDPAVYAQQRLIVGKVIAALKPALVAAGMGDKIISYTPRYNAFFPKAGSKPTPTTGDAVDYAHLMMYDLDATDAFVGATEPYFVAAHYDAVVRSHHDYGIPLDKVVMGFEPGPQAYTGVWGGMDHDMATIARMRDMGLGGVMFWAVNDPKVASNGKTVGENSIALANYAAGRLRSAYVENWKTMDTAHLGGFTTLLYSFLTLDPSPNADAPRQITWNGEAIYDSMSAADVLEVMKDVEPAWMNPYNWMKVKIDALIDFCKTNNKRFLWAFGGWSDLTKTIDDDQVALVDQLVQLLAMGADGIDFDWEHLSQYRDSDPAVHAQQRLIVGKVIAALKPALVAAGMGDKIISYTPRYNAFFPTAGSKYGQNNFATDGEGADIFDYLKANSDYGTAFVGATEQYFVQEHYDAVVQSHVDYGIPLDKVVMGFEPGPQAYTGVWGGMDHDMATIARMREMGLGGVMFWAVNDPKVASNGKTVGENSIALADYAATLDGVVVTTTEAAGGPSCADKTKKKCKKDPACEYEKGECRDAPQQADPCAAAVDGKTGAKAKDACKEVKGCSYKKKACTPCDSNTSKKACKKHKKSCEWKKKNDKCEAKGGDTGGLTGGDNDFTEDCKRTRRPGAVGVGSCKDNTSRNSCKEDALGCKWKNGKRRRRRRQ
ncbi:hypothetical protein JL720_7171 [Aureococcus anophagefferens]|nr:hypothetical protein JL720_7171 [Aureococcus anophagefferens]